MRTSHPRLRILAAALAVLMISPSVVGAQDSIRDMRKMREDARDARAAALAQVDLLEQEDAQIAEILAEIQASIDAQVAKVAGARQALDAAITEVATRKASAEQAAADLIRTGEEISVRAVDAFVGSETGVGPWLQSRDLNRTAVRLAFLDFAAGSDRDLLDRLRRLEARRQQDVSAGVEAQLRADGLRVVVENELEQLEERRLTESAIQAEIEDRIAAWNAEALAEEREDQEMTALIQRTQERALGVTAGSSAAESIRGFIFPKSGTAGSAFGPRRHPIFGGIRAHTGIDIEGATGDPIWASKDGRVIFAGRKGGYGNAVVLQHAGNISTLYAHMSSLEASVGDLVDQREIIGLTGSTGYSTGPHLHFEVRVDGVPKDPELFLPG